jgi:potassium-transporting ATPase potassium-binding subunit
MFMTTNGIIQILLFFGIILALTKPMGVYMTHVYTGERTFLGFIFGPVERFIYRITGIEPDEEMNWKHYAAAMIIFSLASVLALYVLQRLQFYLPLNPQGFAAPSEHLSFNTAVSLRIRTGNRIPANRR